MTGSNDFSQERICSEGLELLNELLGRKVIQLTRCSWLPPQEVISNEGRPGLSAFRFAPGPLLLTIDTGMIVGFASLPELASITVWLEKGPTGELQVEQSTCSDDEMTAINADDCRYSDTVISELIGKTIVSIGILTRASENLHLAELPREAGLLLKFNNGTELVVAHGLHDDSDDMAVIERNQILSTLKDKLSQFDVLCGK